MPECPRCGGPRLSRCPACEIHDYVRYYDPKEVAGRKQAQRLAEKRAGIMLPPEHRKAT